MYTANPRPRRKAKRRPARKNPRKRTTHRKKARRNPTRRSRSASIPAKTRRRVRGRTVTRPASVRITLLDKRGGTRRSAKRRSPKRRSYKKKGRGKKRAKRTPEHLRLPPASAMMENPLGFGFEGMEDYAMENPLSGGELALAFVTGGLGIVAGSMLDRYIATYAGMAATGGPGQAGTMSNGAAIAAAPGIYRILAQAGLAAAFILPAHFVHQPMGRAALQGAGLGVGVRLAGQLLESYVIQKFFGLSSAGAVTAFGSRFYPVEIASTTLAGQLAASPPTATSGSLPTALTSQGLSGSRRALPYGTRPVVQQQVQQQRNGVAGCGFNGSCSGSCGGGNCGGNTVSGGAPAANALANLYQQAVNQAPPGWMPEGNGPCASNNCGPPPQQPVQTPPPTPPASNVAPLSGVNGVGVGRMPVWIGRDD